MAVLPSTRLVLRSDESTPDASPGLSAIAAIAERASLFTTSRDQSRHLATNELVVVALATFDGPAAHSRNRAILARHEAASGRPLVLKRWRNASEATHDA
jgi:hypothetical protein